MNINERDDMVKILIIIAAFILVVAFLLYALLTIALTACGAHMEMQEDAYIFSMGESRNQ